MSLRKMQRTETNKQVLVRFFFIRPNVKNAILFHPNPNI